jgi:hypothetical protein
VNLRRITRIQVAIVWLVLLVGIALLFQIMFIGPQRKNIQQTEEAAEAAQVIADQKPSAVKALAEAKATEAEVNVKFQKIMSDRMPKLDLSDPIAATVRMWDLADEEQALMDRWFASTGARVSGYGFPGWGTSMPGSFPSADLQMLDPLNWNLTVEVRDFSQLLDWLLKLPKAPRLMIMQSVTIQGPREAGQPLIAQVPVTLYQWTGVLPESGGAGAAAGEQATGAGPAAGGRGGVRGGRGGVRGGRGGSTGRTARMGGGGGARGGR